MGMLANVMNALALQDTRCGINLVSHVNRR
jgi:uridylate kinase